MPLRSNFILSKSHAIFCYYIDLYYLSYCYLQSSLYLLSYTKKRFLMWRISRHISIKVKCNHGKIGDAWLRTIISSGLKLVFPISHITRPPSTNRGVNVQRLGNHQLFRLALLLFHKLKSNILPFNSFETTRLFKWYCMRLCLIILCGRISKQASRSFTSTIFNIRTGDWGVRKQ